MQSHTLSLKQVQFDEREDTKVCTIVINDDQVFEGAESFHVELSMPVYALLGGNTRAAVNINDTEDEPTLQFDKKVHHVNESSGAVSVPIERRGERAGVEMNVQCEETRLDFFFMNKKNNKMH